MIFFRKFIKWKLVILCVTISLIISGIIYFPKTQQHIFNINVFQELEGVWHLEIETVFNNNTSFGFWELTIQSNMFTWVRNNFSVHRADTGIAVNRGRIEIQDNEIIFIVEEEKSPRQSYFSKPYEVRHYTVFVYGDTLTMTDKWSSRIFERDIGITVQEHALLGGIWYSRKGGDHDILGEYWEINELTIENGRFIWDEKLLSEFQAGRGSTVRGKKTINGNTITFSIEEELRMWSFDQEWDQRQAQRVFRFFSRNGILVLSQEFAARNEVIVFRRD